MDALTVVSDVANIQNAPGVRKANSELHSVGLGVMNFAPRLPSEKIKLVMSQKKQKILQISSSMMINSTQSNVQWKSLKSVVSNIKTLKSLIMLMANISSYTTQEI